MAQRRKRRKSRSRKKQQEEYPGWVWMIFGLAIGLSVAFAVYVKDSAPETPPTAAAQQPASLQQSIDDNIDHNGESTPDEPVVAEPAKERFDFYKMLPAFEMTVENDTPEVDRDVEPQAIDEPGVYMLQAGSFSTNNDADRRRAELALHGIESRVQRARVNNRDYYRVYIGPIEDLGELNVTRSRLRAANIDVMRIRLGD